MRSNSHNLPAVATFACLLDRLRQNVCSRVRNGEITERGLARRIGVSQPHMHLVLKGAKKLSPEIADTLLNEFCLSVIDLLPAAADRG